MSSNQGVANYSGRQPDNVQNVKQFVNAGTNIVMWMYKKISTKIYITPCDQVNSVIIPKDLYVHGSINTTSDIKLKENVGQITCDEYDSILRLNPKKYNYKDDNDKKMHYGFIAQDVEELYPLLVTEVDDIDTEGKFLTYKTVNYMELIPVMIGKMQKMQQQIDELMKK